MSKTLRVVKSNGMIKLVELEGKTTRVIANLTPEQGNLLGITLLKTSAVLGAIAELKGAAHEEVYH